MQLETLFINKVEETLITKIDVEKSQQKSKLSNPLSSSFRLKMIKNKLRPATHNLLLDEIDNEIIKGHVEEIKYLQRNTESIDWDVPVPFDKDEMWHETQAKQRSMLPNKKIIETSIMGIARQKYSDFAVNQEADASLAK